MVTKKLHLNNDEEALLLLGEQDARLRRLEKEYRVEIFVRNETQGLTLSIRGTTSRAEKAYRKFKETLDQIRSGAKAAVPATAPLSMPEFTAPPAPKDAIVMTAYGKAVRARSPKQKEYVDSILTNDLTFGIGPAGTGKTYLAVACALRALKAHEVMKIVLTRPVVEAGEKLGFLPGDIYEKVHPYLKPLYDAFYGMLGPDKLRMWREDEIVEIIPLAYMRGRTLENAFVILDEAQNTTPEQMMMFLTRMGLGSKMVVTGDITQIDLPNKSHSGLIQIQHILKGIPGISFTHFADGDVVRHDIVRHIIQAYDRWNKK